MAGAVAARWLLTAVFAPAGLGSLTVPGRADGLMAGAFVALREKMGQLPGSGHILAIALADGNWRPA
jgi:hypothetical protein